jgi:hypothetical protein
MGAGAGATLVSLGAGLTAVAVLTPDDVPRPQVVTAVGQAAPPLAAQVPAPAGMRDPVAARPHADAALRRGDADVADRTATRTARRRTATGNVAAAPLPNDPAPNDPALARPAPAGAQSPAQPSVSTRTEVETREIPYETRLVRDPALPRGTRKVEAPGVPGVETLRYQVTLIDGQPADRRLIDAVMTRQPQQRVVAFGAQRAMQHHGKHCGEALNFCVPLGRSAMCPDKSREGKNGEGKNGESREEDGSVALPDLVLEPGDLGYLDGLACRPGVGED